MYGMRNRTDLIRAFEQPSIRQDIPAFRVGDTLRVQVKVREMSKGKLRERLQAFEGIVISRKGAGVKETFTVRKISANSVGVERIFPVHSPNVDSIELVTRGVVRRAKLYYLRDRIGKAATYVKKWQPREKTTQSSD